MVIGVEGNVHVGKTTFINNSFKNFNILKEIEFQPSLKSFERQLYYIEKEKERKNKLHDNTILDRTIISIIVYTMYTKDLKLDEKRKIIRMISEIIAKKEIIIPLYIYLIIYPYKLIVFNHQKLMEEKKTQSSLVDYNYYLHYSLFFSNRLKFFNKIEKNGEYRQILSYNDTIFNSITKRLSNSSKILIDGYMINKLFFHKKYQYLVKNDNNANNYHDIVMNINFLSYKNVVLNNSFLLDIVHLFYRNKISKDDKIKILNNIMTNICLNNYITRIIYIIYQNNKKTYLKEEINFYKTLHRRLGNMSNISIIDNSLLKDIENIDDKPLMLIDLFYEIREGVKEGEL